MEKRTHQRHFEIAAKFGGRTFVLLCFLILWAAACGTKNDETRSKDLKACDLITNSDVEAIQGEPVSDTSTSEQSNGDLVTSRCFYRLPTFSKSVSIEIMHPSFNARSGDAAEEFWDLRFHDRERSENDEASAERDMERDQRGGGIRVAREEEDRELTRPQPVANLGDEAFWTGTQINGSLYVRRGNIIMRLGVGGPEDQAAKIERAKALAERVLKHL